MNNKQVKSFHSQTEMNPIIAAVNHLDKLDLAIKSPCKVIFLLTGSIFNLKEIVQKVKDNDMDIYIHFDLLQGFAKDSIALEYISKQIKPDGIITTKSNLIKKAKNLNLWAIQRLFIFDSKSLETGINSVNLTKPDTIEILPGAIPKIINEIYDRTKIPLIAGGLIRNKEDVIECLKAGAEGISASTEEIWYM
ncbi:glycerol-3-phosphate responsive antiterminator [Vallitalea maricola]|uniref:Glycerol-3-phosphate responsive antiterminator n=1 Tax=Vallitalea maricola TaxID=3074433 RepID=A0ACB5ULU4_9FIRM|nr:glycerol-3-phosphate responsive antiterminator [Vallitalea sp. AN17-2]